MTVEERELQAAAATPAKPPVPYHLTWEAVTPGGFTVRIERDVPGSDLAAVIQNFDKSATSVGLKPPEPPELKIDLPIPSGANPTAATSGEAVWLKEGEGPWRCSLHGPGK